MKSIYLYAIIALTVACTQPQEVQNQAKKEESAKVPFKTYTMEQFMDTKTFTNRSFSADETRLLINSDETGVSNAYSLNIETLEKKPLTQSKDTTYAGRYFPNDDRVFILKDEGGNENYHYFVLNPDGSQVGLGQSPEERQRFGGFTYDDQSFYIYSNRRDPKYFDIYKYDINTLEPKLFFTNETGMNISEVSRDERWLSFQKTNSTKDSQLFLIDLKGDGKLFEIAAHDQPVSLNIDGFSLDSQWLYFFSDENHEFSYLKRYNLKTKEYEDVRKEEWGVSFHYYSHEGTYEVTGFNWDGLSKVEVRNTKTNALLPLENLPEGNISTVRFSRSERYFTFSLTKDNHPPELYFYDLEKKLVKKLTNSLSTEIEASHLVESELIRYAARDGLEIPGYLYKPKMASAQNKVPALIWVHGGPGGQSTPYYNAEKQFLVNHGYALFAVNNRGSSGYGKTFFTADDRKHGKEPLWDCIDAKTYLQGLDWIDSEKIGIIGGSYGGYMTLAALAFEPESFEVGIDIFGVSNWIRTLESIPPYWEGMRLHLYEEIGDPNTMGDYLRSISPVFHGDKIVKPLMVLQGANDPRVIKAESDDMVEAIRQNNGVVEYLIFDDEGHGFTKAKNRIKGTNAMLTFLDTYLKGDGNKAKLN